MKRATWAVCLAIGAGIAPTLSVGCSDTGDSSALPGDDGGAADGGAADGALRDAKVDAAVDAQKKDGKAEDGSQGDGGTFDGGTADTSPEDTGSDSTTNDGGTADTGTEAGSMDSSIEAGANAGPEASADAGAEAGHEAGSDASVDGGVTDASQDSGPPLLPCTASTTGCVQCQGNNSGLCTPTEAAFVSYDIANKIATAPGPDPDAPGSAADSCYACLFENGCIDDDMFMDMGNECEDVPLADGTTAAECEAIVSCILGSGVGDTQCASVTVSACYCGTAPVSGTCQGNPAVGPINGVCAAQIAAGLVFPTTDGTDVTKNFNDTTKAGGRADQLFQCAQSNMCAACL